MKKILVALVISACALFAGEIRVLAAANTSYAFEELLKKFNELYPDTKVELSLGASGGLTSQIQNGAPADIFMAANMGFADKVYESGFGVAKPVVYAQGSLAMFTIRDFKLKNGLDVLKDTKTISIANPKSAPYGEASIEALKNANLFKDIEKKIIYTQKISETLSQALSAADVGFIAASALYDKKISKYKEGVNYVFVDKNLYKPIDQGMVLLKRAENNPEAKAFYDFILSDEAKDIFNKFGYITPK
ncbi:molybdate ABC transporter substrate-binding protein [Campylobacter pinnipediorum]|uniref:molybdate ABC transporter substrate-binding protein n=1 Tax=Campylobacter pinnipediorum TaxID=1965231 RepID=UPI00084D4237|nr:molybdate ABC transporter substrate-binding protein [Campylobacter pinnipediorum]